MLFCTLNDSGIFSFASKKVDITLAYLVSLINTTFYENLMSFRFVFAILKRNENRQNGDTLHKNFKGCPYKLAI